jgi:hypothetical protein
MSDAAIISYFVVGIVCAFGLKFFLRRLRIEPERYWSILLGEGTEAIIVTVLFWPLTLLAILLFCLLRRSAENSERELRRFNKDQRRIKKENPLSGLSLDELLQKVDEHKKSPESSKLDQKQR